MKKLVFMALTSLMVLATSCSKDKDESIEGTWYKESLVVNEKDEVLDECDKQESYTFSSGNFTIIEYDRKGGKCGDRLESKGTYTISGNTITLKNNEHGDEETFIFSISGNILTFSFKDPETINVLTLKKR